MLDCLAVVTFVGGKEYEETLKSMELMWQLIHPKSGSNVRVCALYFMQQSMLVSAIMLCAISFKLKSVAFINFGLNSIL